MLSLIRKFQRSVFILIAGVIIATFSLFGVQYAQKAPKVMNENRVISRGVDGSKIMKEEIEQLSRFIFRCRSSPVPLHWFWSTEITLN